MRIPSHFGAKGHVETIISRAKRGLPQALVLLLLLPVVALAQTSYTWNGSVNNAWNNPANWTPNSGFPLAADHATIVAAGTAPALDASRSVTNLTVTSGTLDLAGFTLTHTGNGVFSGGSVNNGTLAPNTVAGSTTFSGTTFGASVSGTTAVLLFNGSTFNAAVTMTKTGASNDLCTGGNTFNGTATFTTTNGRLYLNNTGVDAFNGNVIVQSSGSGGGVWFGQFTGSSTLAAGRTLTAGTFSMGSLVLRNFTQTGATAQTITLTLGATLYFQSGCTFNGAVTTSSPGLYLNGTTFNAAAHFTKVGATTEYSSGGNTFNGTTEFVVTGPGALCPYNTGVDQFNGNVLVNSTGGGMIFGSNTGSATLAAGRTITVGSTGWSSGTLTIRRLAMPGTTPQTLTLTGTGLLSLEASTTFGGNVTLTAPRVLFSGITVNGNARITKTGTGDDWSDGGCFFNGDLELVNSSANRLGPDNIGADVVQGNLILNNTSTGSIRFGQSSGSMTLAAGRTISIGAGGFAAGTLALRNFTQTGGTAQSLALGTNAVLVFGGGSTFNGNITTTSGGLFMNGTTFNGTGTFTKTGTSHDNSDGGCTFQGDVEFTSASTGAIHLHYNGTDVFNGNIRVNSTANGHITFGSGTGTSTLAAGRTVAVGSLGFSNGNLRFKGFTQLGTTPQVLALGAGAALTLSSGTVFNGNLVVTAGSIYFNGATFNGTGDFTKTGTVHDNSDGGSTFQQDVVFTSASTGAMHLNSIGNDVFNGHIRLNSNASGHITFGVFGGTSTLAAGRTVAVGTAGFNNGTLRFLGFNQVGGTPQSLLLGAGTLLEFGNASVFNGNVVSTSAALFFNGSTFNGTGTFTKNGGSHDQSTGGCVFNGPAEFTVNSTGSIHLDYTGADQFNGNIRVNSTSSGTISFGASGGSATLAAGATLAVGSIGFNTGSLLLRNFSQIGTTAQSILLGTGATLTYNTGTTFNGDVVSVSGRVTFHGTTFNGTGSFTKTAPVSDLSTGGCTFNGDVEFTSTSTGFIYPDYTGTDAFNGNIRVNSTSTGGVWFGASGGSATLAAGRTVAAGSTGFTSGSLGFRGFTQVGTTPQNLVLGTAAALTYGTGSTFNGNVVSTSGSVYFNGVTFNGAGNFTKTGAAHDLSAGGCVFNGNTEFTSTSNGIIYVDYTSTDAFNGDIRVNSTSTGGIWFGASGGAATLAAGRTIAAGSTGFTSGSLGFRRFSQVGPTPQNLVLGTAAALTYGTGSTFNGNVVSTSGSVYFNGVAFNGTGNFTKTGAAHDLSTGGCTFNGNAEFTSTSNGIIYVDYTGTDAFNGDIRVNSTSVGGIWFGTSGGSATLAAGRTVAAGSTGFTSGSLGFRGFTQVGTTPQNLVLGTAAALTYGTGSTFNGNVVSTSGSVYFNGVTFNGTGRYTKTGVATDYSTGGCSFNGDVEFNVSSTGNLSLHNTGVDVFNGNIWVNNTSTGQINFGQSNGSSTMAAGRTIAVGGLGFNPGTLGLRNFVQLGGTAQSLVLGNSATLLVNTGTVFNGNFNSIAGFMQLQGGTFNGTSSFRKTGLGNCTSGGGNLFAGRSELVNAGTGIWYMAVYNGDVYNSDLVLNSTNTGSINFGYSTGTVLMNGGALSIGSAGFSAGGFTFRNFTKNGLAASALNATTAGNTAITFNIGNNFQGPLTTTAANIYLNGTRFEGASVFNKTGTALNTSSGGNVFEEDSEINASGAFTMASAAADDFNGNATFRRLGSGAFMVNNTYNATFSKNVSTVGSTGGSVQFGATASRTIFDGTTVQTFSSDAAFPPNVRNLTLALSGAGELQLLGNVIVQLDLAFTSGVIKPMAATSTSNGLLILNNGITFSDPADANSHVDGFVRKIGNAAFSFPVGNAGVLAPIAISAPTTATHHFTAKYVHDDSHPIHTHTMHDITLHHLSRCEYWILDRTNSTTNVVVTLSYDSVNSCGVSNLSDLVVARWNGTTWKDHGNGGTTGTLAAGTIMTAGPVSAFSPFTLASRTSLNPLPIELVDFDAAPEGSTVVSTWSTAAEMDNDYFEVERSSDGISFEPIGTVGGAGFSQGLLNYAHVDGTPLSGTSYYRLKQVDFDGTATYSQVVPVVRDNANTVLHIWPNPVVDMVNFTLVDGRTAVSVQVHDAAGRLLVDQNSGTTEGNVQIDLANVPAGILFLSVRLDDGSVHQQRILKP